MRKWTALLLSLVLCLSLCACGGAKEEQAAFIVRNGVSFGMTDLEVGEQETDTLEFDDVLNGGFLAAQAFLEGNREKETEFEGFDRANVFYFFDPDTKVLKEAEVFFGDQTDFSASEKRYLSLLERYTEQYGEPAETDDASHTNAYIWVTTDDPGGLEKNGKILESAMWIVPDRDGSVKIELFITDMFNGNYYTYIGMQHIN